MLALMPLLATGGSASSAHEQEHSTFVSQLPPWGNALVVLGVMTGLILSGRFVLAPLFRFIAKARLRETFTAAALLLVIGIALLMTMIGLSPALGTFVAGVVLATSEYRHELEAEIEPFKGLLLGLFFIAVGASIDFGLVAAQPGVIVTLVGALMAVKFLVLAALARFFKLSLSQNLIFSFALAQGGEFAFVLFSFATQNGVIPQGIASPLVASVALSMALTPLAFIVNERIVQPLLSKSAAEERPQDDVHEDNPVIVAGYGRFGQVVARLLRSAGFESTLLDVDSDQIDLVRKFGSRVYYGDATRMDLLHSAGAHKARLLVVAIDDHGKALKLVQEATKHFPRLTILARARGRSEAFDFHDAGVAYVYRETFDSSLRLGTAALELLGMRSYRAHRVARAFRHHDEALLRETARERQKSGEWIQFSKTRSDDLLKVLRAEHSQQKEEDAGWDTEGIRAGIKKRIQIRADSSST
jgi:voltage-gated potassium channel Kch